MAEHTRVNQSKHEDVEQKHHSRQQESQPSSDAFHAWDQGILTFTDTPFSPQTDQHAAWLAGTHSAEHQAKMVLQLQQLYGNTYVQRLLNSTAIQAKLTVSAANDVYEQEADRVAETVTKAENAPLQRWAEEEVQIPLPSMEPSRMEPSRLTVDRVNLIDLHAKVIKPLDQAYLAVAGDKPDAKRAQDFVLQAKSGVIDLGIPPGLKDKSKAKVSVDRLCRTLDNISGLLGSHPGQTRVLTYIRFLLTWRVAALVRAASLALGIKERTFNFWFGGGIYRLNY